MTVIWCDVLTGMTSAFAILLALRHKSRTGKGQFIDVSMLESNDYVFGEILHMNSKEIKGLISEGIIS